MTREEAISRLMQECSRSEKAEFYIRKKLKNWGLETFTDEIVAKLRKDKFIDDSRYVKAFIHDKIVFNKWGKIKIRYQLLSEKIAERIVDEHLREFDESRYKNIISEELRKKEQSLKNLPPAKRKMKLISFGNQRGYEMELIYNFINEHQP